jgi:hypothetical protein
MYIIYCIGDGEARKVRVRNEEEKVAFLMATEEGSGKKVSILDIISI